MAFEFNWRGFAYCLVIIAFCIVAMWVFIPRAHAEESYAVVETIAETATSPTTVSYPNTSIYIEQGQVVYVGDYLDISGVVPPYPSLAYWNGYDMYDAPPTYNITLPERKSGYYKFYLDPEIFASRTGKWYKYDYKFERQGNNLAFIVRPQWFRNTTMTLANGTVVNISDIRSNTTEMVKPVPPLLPAKHEADYLISRAETFNISTSKLSALWLFNGDDNSILYSINNTEKQLTFNTTEIASLEPGDYKIIIQEIGDKATGLDVIFSGNTIRWFDRGLFTIHSVDTTNMVPDEVIKQMEAIFPRTLDNYTVKTVSVQEPAITIVRMDQVSVGSAKEFWHDSSLRGNVSLMDVRGYTNVLPGVPVSVTLDENRNDPREIAKKYTYTSNATGTYLGDWRMYRVYVPLYWDNLAPGMHTLTARTSLGGMVAHDFPVTEMPADSYIPPQTVRYVEDRNPWVPTPTPEIVKVVEQQVVTQQIPVPMPPSPEEVSVAAAKLTKEQNDKTATIIVMGTAALIMFAIAAWFVWSLYRARLKEVQK